MLIGGVGLQEMFSDVKTLAFQAHSGDQWSSETCPNGSLRSSKLQRICCMDSSPKPCIKDSMRLANRGCPKDLLKSASDELLSYCEIVGVPTDPAEFEW